MATQSTGILRMGDWVEESYQEGGQQQIQLAKANSKATFTGDIEGSGGCQWLLAYPLDASVTFVGLQSFVGKLAGRTGSFTLKMTGTFEDSTAHVTWSVVPGSGTGELKGLSGEGGYSAPLGQPDVKISLEHGIES